MMYEFKYIYNNLIIMKSNKEFIVQDQSLKIDPVKYKNQKDTLDYLFIVSFNKILKYMML